MGAERDRGKGCQEVVSSVPCHSWLLVRAWIFPCVGDNYSLFLTLESKNNLNISLADAMLNAGTLIPLQALHTPLSPLKSNPFQPEAAGLRELRHPSSHPCPHQPQPMAVHRERPAPLPRLKYL